MISSSGDRAGYDRGHRQTIARATGALYLAGTIIAITRILLLNGATPQAATAVLVALLGFPVAAAVYLLPFHRWDPFASIAFSLLAAAHLGGLLYLTGGSQSLFWPFCVFIMLSGIACQRDIRALGIIVATCLAVSASPVLYQGLSSGYWRLLAVRALVILVSAGLGFRLLSGSRENALKAVRQREEFLLNMAHIIKTPLTSLRRLGVAGKDAFQPGLELPRLGTAT